MKLQLKNCVALGIVCHTAIPFAIMKYIKLKFTKIGKCDLCSEKEEPLYKVQWKGKVVGSCEICLMGFYGQKYEVFSEEIVGSKNRNLILKENTKKVEENYNKFLKS